MSIVAPAISKHRLTLVYRLETMCTLDGEIHRLALGNFKGRFAPGKDFAVEYVRRKGFVACGLPDELKAIDAMQTVMEIVRAHPGSNKSQLVAFGKQAAIGKHQVEACLKDGPFHRERGTGRELLYSVAEDRIPEIPAPREREYGNQTAPAEVVA